MCCLANKRVRDLGDIETGWLLHWIDSGNCPCPECDSKSTASPEPAGDPGPKPGGESSAMLPAIPPKQVRRAVLTVEPEPEGVVLGPLPITPLEVEMMARFGMSIRRMCVDTE